VGSVLVLFLLTGFHSTAQSSDSSEPTGRDSRGLNVIRKALSAMGVATNATLSSFRAEGTKTRSWNGKDLPEQSFRWTFSGTEFRMENSDHGQTNAFATNHGDPRSSNSKFGRVPIHVARANGALTVPAMRLMLIQNQTAILVSSPTQVTINGTSFIHIQTCECGDKIGKIVTVQNWYFDPQTYLPSQVVVRNPSFHNAVEFTEGTIAFSGYSSVDGILTPLRIHYTQTDGLITDMTITKAKYNSDVASAEFEISSEAR
jgi:hypothetical protein